jgi:hypothetical protein
LRRGVAGSLGCCRGRRKRARATKRRRWALLPVREGAAREKRERKRERREREGDEAPQVSSAAVRGGQECVRKRRDREERERERQGRGRQRVTFARSLSGARV